MALSQAVNKEEEKSNLTTSKKRRLRRKKLHFARYAYTVKKTKQIDIFQSSPFETLKIIEEEYNNVTVNGVGNVCKELEYIPEVDCLVTNIENKMSSKDLSTKSREDVLVAIEAKKLSKHEAKKKNETTKGVQELPETQAKNVQNEVVPNVSNVVETKLSTAELSKVKKSEVKPLKDTKSKECPIKSSIKSLPKGKDEVDRAIKEDISIKADTKTKILLEDTKTEVNILKDDPKDKENNLENASTDKSREQIKAERAAKKAAKLAKKKVVGDREESENNKKPIDSNIVPVEKEKVIIRESKVEEVEGSNLPVEKDLTVRDMVETLKDIVNVAKEFQSVTDKVKAIDLGGMKSEDNAKSKAELKAERRAKQEAQRAAKQEQQKPLDEPTEKEEKDIKDTQKLPSKPKSVEKPKLKAQSLHRVNWFQHLYTEHDKEALKKIALNSNLHPAVIKLGVQLASQVVTGSNARCIALLDALKKMIRDYSLPAKTEFARGLESHLAASLEFLWAMRQPSASQTNAIKHFRRQLTQLPNNVDEFDAKKELQEEIDRYIREQIDMAGEAISTAVRNKIANGDNILTYGCSSLIERILCEAWESGLRFRAVVAGDRVRRGAREMLRRLMAYGLPCTYVDISAVSFLMGDINKVILGAGSLLVNGSVLGPVGSSQVALVARSYNVPVLVACETHKFSERVQTDSFVYNEIGDPDDLIDTTDENSPLKDWRSNPNLTLLNLTYDVTPPSLVTAVVTELAILPCTSAPVVLRFKLSEYGM